MSSANAWPLTRVIAMPPRRRSRSTCAGICTTCPCWALAIAASRSVGRSGVAAAPMRWPCRSWPSRYWPPRRWIDVALQQPDVQENRFKEAEVAADLCAVDSDNAEGDYATPRGVCGITFLTEGLKRVLLWALQRLSGHGGDPVIGLQTAFGGGKTHTLLAVYHLARHLKEGGEPADLPGLGPVVSGL